MLIEIVYETQRNTFVSKKETSKNTDTLIEIKNLIATIMINEMMTKQRYFKLKAVYVNGEKINFKAH